MIPGPWQGIRSQFVNSMNPVDMKPPPEGMERPGSGHKTPAPVMHFGVAENAEEQKKISRLNALIAKVPLG
ncbi:hypothetical protein DXI23_07890 [Marinobacter flavimaris]|uniref:Uncharacterized protein n=1 Tax=Marinobacter flavimaris TaxID=262076 RepID=A0A3D8H3Q5_9GAMM|nr:hypothetical protein MDHKLMBL_07610 [Marinobacter flavimaris]RDU41317.1 hypothetical protein DXI23_07890 [Marinobacter flavimaris]